MPVLPPPLLSSGLALLCNGYASYSAWASLPPRPTILFVGSSPVVATSVLAIDPLTELKVYKVAIPLEALLA